MGNIDFAFLIMGFIMLAVRLSESLFWLGHCSGGRMNFVISGMFERLACENICFSSLLVDGDVSRGGTSATQLQKLHTDDVKSVRNPVRSANWSTE